MVQHASDSSLGRALAAWAPGPPTILHALVAAGAQPGVGVTLLPDQQGGEAEHRTYAALGEGVVRRAAQLRALGIGPGERVLIVLPTGWPFLETFFGLMLIGAVPVPAYPPSTLSGVQSAIDRLRHMVADAGIRCCLTDPLLHDVLAGLAAEGEGAARLVDLESLPAPEIEGLHPQRGEVAFTQYTSGSTRDPRGVVVGHGALLANIRAAGEASEVCPTDCLVSWLPLYHDMGIVGGLMWPIYWRIPLVLMSPLAFLIRPRTWLEAISDHGGTITMGPNFAYARCAARVRDLSGLDLSTLRIALNGAEPVSAATHRAVLDRLGPAGFREGVMYPCYGLAEAVVAVTFSEPGAPLHVDRIDRGALAQGRAEPTTAEEALEVVAVGRALPGHDLRIVDDEGGVLPERRVGEIQVRGPSVMGGYHDNPEATAAAFQEGRLRTGDLGYLVEGRLHVTGRAKDLIIIRGQNHHAEDIERVVEAVPGIRPGRVVAFGTYDEAAASDRLVVVLEDGPTEEADRAALAEAVREAIGDRIGLRVHEVVFVPKGGIGRTPSGKRQRQRARRAYERGTLGA